MFSVIDFLYIFGEAEVDEDDILRFVEHDILKFDVSVNYVSGVDLFDGVEKLFHHFLDNFFWNLPDLLDIGEQIPLGEEVSQDFGTVFGDSRFEQLDDIGDASDPAEDIRFMEENILFKNLFARNG